MRLTIEQAEAEGFTVDICCYPPHAYKGDRFRPDADVRRCFTPLEAALIDMLQSYANTGFMDPSERSRFEKLKKGVVL